MPGINQEIDKKSYPPILEPLILSKPFRAQWIGNSLSVFDSSISGVIIPLLVYSLSHSTVAMGLIMTVYMLPNVIILPFEMLILCIPGIRKFD